MKLLSRISISFGRRIGGVSSVVSLDAVMPRLGNVSPQLAWGTDETDGMPRGHWQRGAG